MGCSSQSCVDNVSRALLSIPSVHTVQVRLEENRAIVVGTAPAELLVEKIEVIQVALFSSTFPNELFHFSVHWLRREHRHKTA